MAGLGLVYPYQALWLSESVGLGGIELGFVLALRPAMGILFQPLWGHVADRSGRRPQVLALVLGGVALAYSALPWVGTLPALAAVYAAAACFGTSVMPLGTSVTMEALGPTASQRFGRVRAWGTLGYLILMFSFPRFLAAWREQAGLSDAPGEPGLGAMFLGAGALSLCAGVLVARLRADHPRGERSRRGDLGQLLRHGPFVRLLGFVFASHLLLQGPIQFFPLLVESRGGDLETLANLWVPMVLLEIPLVYFAGKGVDRFGARALVMLGVGADGLRWVLALLAPDFVWMGAANLLHGVVIAGLLIGSALYVEQVVPERLRSTGQGVLAMFSVSFANVFSNLGAGALLDRLGVDSLFWIAGLGAVGLALSGLLWLPKPRRMEAAGAADPD